MRIDVRDDHPDVSTCETIIRTRSGHAYRRADDTVLIIRPSLVRDASCHAHDAATQPPTQCFVNYADMTTETVRCHVFRIDQQPAQLSGFPRRAHSQTIARPQRLGGGERGGGERADGSLYRWCTVLRTYINRTSTGQLYRRRANTTGMS